MPRYLKVVFSVVVLFLVFSGWYAVYSGYFDVWRYRGLLGNLSSDLENGGEIGEPTAEEIADLPPDPPEKDFLTPAYTETAENYYEIAVVSTGEFGEFSIKNYYTKKDLAQATFLKVITHDVRGNPKVFKIIVQLLPVLAPAKNLISWVADPSEDSQERIFSSAELAQAFPTGSPLIFFPLINYDVDKGLFAQAFPEYVFNARQYYGENLGRFVNYFTKGLEGNLYRDPVLPYGINKLK